MRIVVSGTHASGKSTLIADFAGTHRDYELLPDPFELIDETSGASVSGFLRQLSASAHRLEQLPPTSKTIAERGPIDLLAYLDALESLGRADVPEEVLERARDLTEAAMRHVDLLVVLPLETGEPIWVPDDEDPELRAAMNDSLLDLVFDGELTSSGTRVEVLAGDPAARSRGLDVLVRDDEPHQHR